MLRNIFFTLFIFTALSLFGAVNEPVKALHNELINFVEELSWDAKGVYVETPSPDYRAELSYALQKILLQKNILVVNDKNKAEHVLSAVIKVEQTKKTSDEFLSRQIIMTQKIYLVLSLVNRQTSEVIKISEFSKSLDTPMASSNEITWYDPVMITAILGGMVYLFYYGNK